jgi:hypothetical protein
MVKFACFFFVFFFFEYLSYTFLQKLNNEKLIRTGTHKGPVKYFLPLLGNLKLYEVDNQKISFLSVFSM